jgi:hypothetical protein
MHDCLSKVKMSYNTADGIPKAVITEEGLKLKLNQRCLREISKNLDTRVFFVGDWDYFGMYMRMVTRCFGDYHSDGMYRHLDFVKCKNNVHSFDDPNGSFFKNGTFLTRDKDHLRISFYICEPTSEFRHGVVNTFNFHKFSLGQAEHLEKSFLCKIKYNVLTDSFFIEDLKIDELDFVGFGLVREFYIYNQKLTELGPSKGDTFFFRKAEVNRYNDSVIDVPNRSLFFGRHYFLRKELYKNEIGIDDSWKTM